VHASERPPRASGDESADAAEASGAKWVLVEPEPVPRNVYDVGIFRNFRQVFFPAL
jgi:hypothetical protein